jgi:hypothetical protein
LRKKVADNQKIFEFYGSYQGLDKVPLLVTAGGRTYKQVGGTIVPLLYKEKRKFPLDHHALWIDPARPDRIILGTDRGLYFSYDRTKSRLLVNTPPCVDFSPNPGPDRTGNLPAEPVSVVRIYLRSASGRPLRRA